MVEITNRAKGPRIIYAKGTGSAPVARTLAPGETADVELFRAVDKDPVVKAWVDAEELIIGPAPAGEENNGGGESDGNDGGAGLDTMTDEQLREFLTVRGVTPGNWQRKRLLTEAEAVKDVTPEQAA
ncbi:MAG: hypothetical protein K2X71_23660 [Methylobacterium sp.]|uniref:hypothetical protein n=1 Tax=Methylobacterium sp. TaxID=409 RepID=UPI00258A3CFE|nr:hypothetical protein [Methylobacterium sp.]MBY0298991.1 hypothetical protein [Methylobacterium sp.]